MKRIVDGRGTKNKYIIFWCIDGCYVVKILKMRKAEIGRNYYIKYEVSTGKHKGEIKEETMMGIRGMEIYDDLTLAVLNL